MEKIDLDESNTIERIKHDQTNNILETFRKRT